MYPLDCLAGDHERLVKEYAVHGSSGKSTAWLDACLFGAFAYFDDAQNLLQVNAVSLTPTKYKLYLDGPFASTEAAFQQLVRLERVQRVTLRHLSLIGLSHFSWVNPAEMPGGEPLLGEAPALLGEAPALLGEAPALPLGEGAALVGEGREASTTNATADVTSDATSAVSWEHGAFVYRQLTPAKGADASGSAGADAPPTPSYIFFRVAHIPPAGSRQVNILEFTLTLTLTLTPGGQQASQCPELTLTLTLPLTPGGQQGSQCPGVHPNPNPNPNPRRAAGKSMSWSQPSRLSTGQSQVGV